LTSTVRFAPRSRRPSRRWIHRLLGRPPSGRFDRAPITPIVTGYDPDFMPGYEVPLPSQRAMSRIAARNAEALSGASIDELQYHHFSIVMHLMQRLALFAACNIDGRKPKKVDRNTGAVSASQRKRSSSLTLNSSRIGARSTRCQPDNLSRTGAFYCSTFRFSMGGHGVI
jgi:hypothetical protein